MAQLRKENSCLWYCLYHFRKIFVFILAILSSYVHRCSHTTYTTHMCTSRHTLPLKKQATKGSISSGWIRMKSIPGHFIKNSLHVLATGKDIGEHYESWCPSPAGDILLSVLHSLKEKGIGKTLSIASFGSQSWEMEVMSRSGIITWNYICELNLHTLKSSRW